MSDAVRHQPKCPSCQNTPESWTVRRLAHGERGIQCPSCSTVLTETFLRDVWGVTLPEDAAALEDR